MALLNTVAKPVDKDRYSFSIEQPAYEEFMQYVAFTEAQWGWPAGSSRVLTELLKAMPKVDKSYAAWKANKLDAQGAEGDALRARVAVLMKAEKDSPAA